MNKMIKFATILMTTASMGSVVLSTGSSLAKASSTQATEQDQNTKLDSLFKKADRYVKLNEGQFVLDNDAHSEFNKSEIQTIKKQINESNSEINVAKSNEDPDNLNVASNNNDKTVTVSDSETTSQNISPLFPILAATTYHKGVNKVNIHWNYITIYIDKSNLSYLKNGTIGAAGFLAGKIKQIYVATASSAIIGVLSTITIKGGMWFRIHTYIYTALEKWGYQ